MKKKYRPYSKACQMTGVCNPRQADYFIDQHLDSAFILLILGITIVSFCFYSGCQKTVPLFDDIGSFDAIIGAAGAATFGSLDELTDANFMLALTNKLMGQVNLVRLGRSAINDNGSFTLTSGMLSQNPMPGSASISMVNAGLEGFVRAAALEMPRGVRINAVSPVFVKETMEILGIDSTHGMPSQKVALAYRETVESQRNGEVLDVRDFA